MTFKTIMGREHLCHVFFLIILIDG